jgi:hypothetical protein
MTTHDSNAHIEADSIGFVTDCVECQRERFAMAIPLMWAVSDALFTDPIMRTEPGMQPL